MTPLPPHIAQEARRAALAVLAVGSAAGIALWRVFKPMLRTLAQVLLAVIVIFEEWGWQPLSALLARLARFKPWAMAERWIAGLPPYGALAAFALPMTLLFPLKLLAVYLFANGKLLLGSALLIGAKLTSTAFVARIFTLTKPSLMQIGWFARAYARFLPWEAAAMAWLRGSWAWRAGRVFKHRAARMARSGWAAAKPRLVAWLVAAKLRWAEVRPRLQGAAAVALREVVTRVRAVVRMLRIGRDAGRR